MNWEKFWNHTANTFSDPLMQVQRKDNDSVKKTAENIIFHLDIKKQDDILDVCCGNGLLTSLIAPHCKSIQGIDISENLITLAKAKYPTINFQREEAIAITKHYVPATFDKVYLQFSFQYFDQKGMGEKVIKEIMQVLKPGGKLFIGDIPDHANRWNHYNTLLKKFYYITSTLRGKNRMGKFWKKKELQNICKRLKVKGKVIIQPSHLPYAHYRFDYLIEK